MLLLFFALPPITAYPDAPLAAVVPVIVDEDDELVALLAHFEYFE
jgi:hypothetical protein